MSVMTRIGVVLLTVLSGISTGCKSNGDDVVGDEPDIAGTYHLVSIDGNEIPFAPEHLGRQQPTVVAGTITLRDGGAFASTMEYSNASGRSMNRTFAGTYTTDGEEYVLTWQGAGRTTATIEESTFTMNNEGMLFVYEK